MSVAMMLVLEAISRSSGASMLLIYGLVLFLIVLAVGAYEAWSRKRGVLGWILNFVAAAFGAFLAVGLLALGMRTILPRIEPAIAPQVLNYATAAVGACVLVLLSWFPIKIIDLFRSH